MGFCNNSCILILLWLLRLLLNHLCICRASDQVLCISSEQQALLNFKQHLLDPSGRLASWSEETDCCNWTSIVCDDVTGHILQLHLNTSTPIYYSCVDETPWLGGEIHPSLLDLRHLSYLDLSGNDFSHMQIPSFLGSLKSLKYLNLSNIGFSGSIPHQIGNLSRLNYLDLGGNSFNGNIPHQIGNLSSLLYLRLQGGYDIDNDEISFFSHNLQWLSSLSSLKYLQLSLVNLSNAIDWLHVLQSLPSLRDLHLTSCALLHHVDPTIVINFTSLAVLDLLDCFDFGASSIPRWIFQLKKLVSLKLSYNYFQGFIPYGIQNLTFIENLDLSGNSFNNSIPEWLYSLRSLKSLSLSSNNLNGSISHSIGNLTSLVTLDLSDNQLKGPIPSSLGNLCSLKSVSFSYNKFNQQVSEILATISRCASNTMESLFLVSSKLYGHLTRQIGSFKNLLSLDLSDNSIQSEIPESLRNITTLNQLGLSGNRFNGNPFEVIGSLSALQSLGISDNLFQGEVTEDHLANFTMLYTFDAGRNKLILKVGPNWKPSFQKLNSLYMASLNLCPHFPSWIKSLRCLEILSIANNNISDSIPTWVWDAFTHAYYFDFSNNNIHGDLSHIMKNPINVSHVDLSSNYLSGHLPHISPHVVHLDFSSNWFSRSINSFFCLKKEEPMGLEYLNLASNNLSGEIPDCLKMWSNLQIIKFDNNHFKGNLPASMGSLSWLNSLQLRNNTLSGGFPTCLKNNTKLLFLDLRENQFSGIIPSFMGGFLLNLKVLLLKSNKFKGEIPDQICSLNSLQILDLAQNNLTGQIPKCINHLRDMQLENKLLNTTMFSRGNHSSYSISDVLLWLKGRDYIYRWLGLITNIDLSDNRLSGEIPIEITFLKGLLFLNLSNNLLSGEIPQNIGIMASLESMDFSKNQLLGKIPSSLSDLSFLNKLNLSHNNLWGKIPTGTQLQSFEESSFVGNDLCSPPLPNNCNDLQDVPNHDYNAKKTKDGINWFYVSISLGFVIGFWALVGPLLYSRSWRCTYFQFLDCMWYKLQCWSC